MKMKMFVMVAMLALSGAAFAKDNQGTIPGCNPSDQTPQKCEGTGGGNNGGGGGGGAGGAVVFESGAVTATGGNATGGSVTNSGNNTANGGAGGSVSGVSATGGSVAAGAVNNTATNNASNTNTANGGAGGNATGGNVEAGAVAVQVEVADGAVQSNYTYKEVRQAPAIGQGSFAIAGCSVAGNAGASGPGGAGFLGFGFTPQQCYDFMLAQAYQSLGEKKAACDILRESKAGKRQAKRGITLPACEPEVKTVVVPTPVAPVDLSPYATKEELNRAFKASQSK